MLIEWDHLQLLSLSAPSKYIGSRRDPMIQHSSWYSRYKHTNTSQWRKQSVVPWLLRDTGILIIASLYAYLKPPVGGCSTDGK